MRSTCQRNLYYNIILRCSVAYWTIGFFYLLKPTIGPKRNETLQAWRLCHQRKVKWTLNNGFNFFLTKLCLNLRQWSYGNLLNSVLSLFEGGKSLVSSLSVSCLLLEERYFDKETSLSSARHHGVRNSIL